VAGCGSQRNLVAVDGERRGARAERHTPAARRRVRDIESAGQALVGLRSRVYSNRRRRDLGAELFERAAVRLVAHLDDPRVVSAPGRNEIERLLQAMREFARLRRAPFSGSPRIERDVSVAASAERPVPVAYDFVEALLREVRVRFVQVAEVL